MVSELALAQMLLSAGLVGFVQATRIDQTATDGRVAAELNRRRVREAANDGADRSGAKIRFIARVPTGWRSNRASRGSGVAGAADHALIAASARRRSSLPPTINPMAIPIIASFFRAMGMTCRLDGRSTTATAPTRRRSRS